MSDQPNLEEKLLPNQISQQKADQSKAQLTEKQKSIKDQYFSKKRYLSADNLFQRLFFTWISPLLTYGYRIDLEQKSIPFLKDQDKPKIDFNKMVATFQNQVKNNKSKREGITITKTIFKAFKKQFATIFIFASVITVLQMYMPILSHDVIDYIAEGDRTIGKGLAYFFAIFGIALFLSITQTFFFYYFGILGYNLSNTFSLLIYNKALKHPLITQKQFAIADIINYSQVDAQRLTYMGFQMVALLYTPIQIIFGLTLLYIYIGVSFLVGMGVMIALMLCTLVFTKVAASANDKLLKAKDARMKIAEQILQIMKFIKVNALQKYFFQKVNRKRQAELKLIKKVNLCYVAVIFLYWLCPPMIVSFTFLTYVSLGNQISPAKAFFTIIIFNILQFPIRLLPGAISQLIQIWSSLKRIQNFLLASELSQQCINQTSNTQQNYAVEVVRGHFLWGKQKEKQQDKKKQKTDRRDKEKQSNQNKVKKDEGEQKQKKQTESVKSSMAQSDANSQQKIKQSILTQSQQSMTMDTQKKKKDSKYIKALHGININFPAREVTMIIGDIGSGKSSLLYAILNQMTPQPEKDPKITINGSIAYSAQKAWIMTGTVKENIVFFQQYNQKRFKDAIHYACLQDDLKIFNKGIDTQIGQKGVNLSGGQKARIGLARALYSNKDIYLLDDILSAVDVHVGKFLMEETILKYLRDKTVIMPTHAIKYLDKSDNIVIMKKGKIIANGSYKQVSDCEQFQQIMKLQQKKQQGNELKPSKQEQAIVNELKLVKQATISKQKQSDNQVKNPSTQYTDKIVQQLIMPQDHKKGEVSLDVYKQYVNLNGGGIFLFSVLFCMVTWTTLSALSNIQVQKWCEDQQHHKNYLYFYLILAISATFFSGARAYILITSGIKQGRTIHKKVMKALLYTSITKFYNRVPVGRILNRLSKDLRQIDQVIGYCVGGTLICFFSLVSSLVMCLYASTPFILIPIALVGFLCQKLLRYYLRSQRQCTRLQNITTSPIVSGFTSAINGVGTIRAYGLTTQFLNTQISKVDINKRMRIARQAMQSWFSLRLALCSFVINMSALLFCILNKNENASLIGLLLTYAGMLNDDIIGFAFSYANLQLKMIAIERVNTFSKLQPEPGYAEYCKKWRTKQQGSDLNAITQGNIEFKKFSTKYREGLPLVINNITLNIQKGHKVGIVGRTGAGKSTLINCLLRILDPVQGQIVIDGKQIRDYNLKDLRSCMTMIQQEPTLMNGSFRDNLDPACRYGDAEINQILKQCNLAELVQSKGGLDSKVTNQNLSVGEKQLLCICRAFLKKSKIILVDQATANIDVKNDKLIQQVIATAFKDSTVLTIAHRLSTIQNCYKIIVLGQGKVLQWGDTRQLMKKPGGIYRKMCQQNDDTYLL